NGNDLARAHLSAELASRNKRVLLGANVVVIVGPIANAGLAIELRLRWQRRPADIIVPLAPRDPGGPPMFPWYPDPADSAEANPAAVVIGRPAELFVGNPGPTGIGVNPVAVGVGPPVAQLGGLTRLENVTVIACLHPVAVRLQFAIKRGIGAVLGVRRDGARRS